MAGWGDILTVALVGLGTTSSSILGAALGLYMPLSRRFLACILAFAAGALISALAIDLGYEGADQLRHAAFSTRSAWGVVGGGFALGAVVYYLTSLFLEKRGAAVRLPTKFQEYALSRKRKESRALITLLSRCDLLRHLPPEAIEQIVPAVKPVCLAAGEVLFGAGDPGDALFIVADGAVEVSAESGTPLARLTAGQAFGEMALLSDGVRTATVRAAGATDLLRLDRDDFQAMLALDPHLAATAQRLSHERALANLAKGGPNADRWARVASGNLQKLSGGELSKLLAETGSGAGLAIVFGNILDTIPGCLVIGARFDGFASLSLTLILGMFIGGVPEAAASAALLKRAGFTVRRIFGMWSTVLVAGLLAAASGKLFIGDPDSLAAVFCQAVAGGAVLAVVAHAMIPEAIHDGGSLVVLPTVAGFLFALYLSLSSTAG